MHFEVDWNKEFQEVLERPDGPEKFSILAKTAADFVYMAKT